MLLALTGRRREECPLVLPESSAGPSVRRGRGCPPGAGPSAGRGRPPGAGPHNETWPRATLPVPGVFSASLLVTHWRYPLPVGHL